MAKPMTVVFVWEQFGPYHIDRCNAVAKSMGNTHTVIGIEIAESSPSHLWNRPPAPDDFCLITLFKGISSAQSKTSIFFRLFKEIRRARPSIVFTCHYERLEIFFVSLLLKLIGIPTVAMQDSKFDDKPRHLFREIIKFFFFIPYAGVIVSGMRTENYMKFFGFKGGNIVDGYDTLSIDRIVSLAGQLRSPDDSPYLGKHFTIIARLVEKKNLFMAVRAYAKYCDIVGPAKRMLHICGDGHLMAQLQAEVERQRIDGIVFCGTVQPEFIPSKLAQSLALLLPSSEEQWGLVANEAVAVGLPLLLSTNCGAADSLLRTGVNGFIYEPDNPDGLAYFMDVLGKDEVLWRRMCEASRALRPIADSRRFAEAVSFFLHRFQI